MAFDTQESKFYANFVRLILTASSDSYVFLYGISARSCANFPLYIRPPNIGTLRVRHRHGIVPEHRIC